MRRHSFFLQLRTGNPNSELFLGVPSELFWLLHVTSSSTYNADSFLGNQLKNYFCICMRAGRNKSNIQLWRNDLAVIQDHLLMARVRIIQLWFLLVFRPCLCRYDEEFFFLYFMFSFLFLVAFLSLSLACISFTLV